MLTGQSYWASHLNSREERLNDYESIDQMWVRGEDIGVKEARELLRLSGQQPLGSKRLLVILNAQALSEEVQNTLLKLTEEPPSFLTVVLQTPSFDSLLPTLRSRLQPLFTVDDQGTDSELPAGFLKDMEQTKKILESTRERSELTALLERALRVYGKQLLESTGDVDRQVRQVELLDLSSRRLTQNVNQKLVIDALLLNWPSQSSSAED